MAGLSSANRMAQAEGQPLWGKAMIAGDNRLKPLWTAQPGRSTFIAAASELKAYDRPKRLG
jgi:hypothetical protein